MFKHILIPTDGDPGSRRAIEHGIKLARSMHARITGIYVMAEIAYPDVVGKWLGPPTAELRALAQAHAERLLAPVRRRAARVGVKCETLIVRGDRPYEAIVAAADQARCDLIVMASHGRRGITRLVLGSQTLKVLSHTAIAVLVVR